MRLSYGIEDAGDGGEGYWVWDLYFGRSIQDLVLEGKRKGAEVDDGHVFVADELHCPDVPGGVIHDDGLYADPLQYCIKPAAVRDSSKASSIRYFSSLK